MDPETRTLKRKNPTFVGWGFCLAAQSLQRMGSLTITYFHTGIRTIIGVESFHGPVRDGKGWYQLAMVIRHKGVLWWGLRPSQPIWGRSSRAHSCWTFILSASVLLVLLWVVFVGTTLISTLACMSMSLAPFGGGVQVKRSSANFDRHKTHWL